MTTIRHELGKIHNSYNSSDDRLNKVQRLKYKTLVPCDCSTCKHSQNKHFYKLDILCNFQDKERDEIRCDISADMVSVRRLIDGIDLGRSRSVASETPLQYDMDLRNKKLIKLRSALAIETDTNTIFKLDQQIENEEKEIQDLVDRLN